MKPDLRSALHRSWLSRLSLRHRIVMLVAPVIGCLLVGAVILERAIAESSAALDRQSDAFNQLDAIASANRAFASFRYWLTDRTMALVVGDTERSASSQRSVERSQADMLAALQRVADAYPDAARDLRTRLLGLSNLPLDMAAAIRAGSTADTRGVAELMGEQIETMASSLDAIDLNVRAAAVAAQETALRRIEATREVAYVFTLVGLAVSIAAAILIYRWVVGPLNRISTMLTSIRVADGRLDGSRLSGSAEVQRLSETLHAFLDSKVSQGRAETAAANANRRYRNLYENALTGIAAVAADGRLIDANAAMATMLGYYSVVELHRGIQSVPADLLLRQADLRRLLNLASGRTHARSLEVPLRRHDGSNAWALLSCRRDTDEKGKPQFWVIAVDITERKETEVALAREKTQTESANQAKAVFLANMSHELRTPLNAVIGFSEIIRQETFGPIGDPRYVDYAEDISRSGRHLLAVVNDILDMAKIESGAREIEDETLDSQSMIRQAVTAIQPMAERRWVTVEVRLSSNLPLLVADRRASLQVLINLLSNAVKFSPEGRTVTVTDAVQSDGGLSIAVSDRGPGMTSEEIEIALRPFGQVDQAFNRAHEGTGLGLPISASLMHLMGGVLDINSIPGSGTTVWVRFPPSRSLDRSSLASISRAQ